MATLGQYMHWLREQGGSCKTGIGADDIRGMVPVIKLTGPDGKRSIVWGSDNQAEELSDLMVIHLDGRLGIKSPFIGHGYADD